MSELKNQIRCTGCRKVLGTGILNDGEISIKCKCGVMNTLIAKPKKTESPKNFVYNEPYQKRLNLTKK